MAWRGVAAAPVRNKISDCIAEFVAKSANVKAKAGRSRDLLSRVIYFAGVPHFSLFDKR